MMLQMSAMMREGGLGGGPFGGAGGTGGFPALGNPGGFPAPGTPGGAISPTSPASNPPQPQGVMPFASMFGQGAGAGGASPGAAGALGGFDPAIMQQQFGMGAGNQFRAFNGAAAPAVPADTRPPEERF